jgi:outer membrane lipoprotein-sorting protein
MRRIVLALLLAVSAPLLMGAGQPAPQARHLDLSDADGAALDGISAYLNSITTLKGGFMQIAGSGDVSEGTFYISKPGRMRFEYRPPTPTLIVADGHSVAVANTRLNTVDRYALGDTPLRLILSNKIDLRHDSALVSIEHQQGAIVVGLRTSNNRSQANIALTFAAPEYELRQWTVIDNQGTSTTVALRNLEPGAALSPALFVLPDKNPTARRRED